MRHFIQGWRLHLKQNVGTTQYAAGSICKFHILVAGVGKLRQYARAALHQNLRARSDELARHLRHHGHAAFAGRNLFKHTHGKAHEFS